MISSRLDKDVFKDGLTVLQGRFETRFYTTTLDFSHDLCEVIHVGINIHEYPKQYSVEAPDASPTKHNTYSETRDRKRLGKRILKSVQPQLEIALKAEADVATKNYADLQKELEGMIDASLEIRKQSSSRQHQEAAAAIQTDQDVVMTDAAEEGHITVAEAQSDGEAGGQDTDKMELDDLSIEVKEEKPADSGVEIIVDAVDAAATKGEDAVVAPQQPEDAVLKGVKSAPTPPDFNDGYAHVPQTAHPAPLTPPQSNGSLGHGTDNTLTEGGIPWYLKAFEPEGTTAIEEQWAGREAVRSLSEELTDMDDEELNDLEFNVEDSTITASPVNPLPETSLSAGLKAGGNSSSRRKGGAASGGITRKRLRSSARRR